MSNWTDLDQHEFMEIEKEVSSFFLTDVCCEGPVLVGWLGIFTLCNGAVGQSATNLRLLSVRCAVIFKLIIQLTKDE